MLTARQHGGAERSHAPPGRVATRTAHAECVHHQAAAQAGWRDRRHRSAVHPAQQTWPSCRQGRRHARRRRRDATPGEPWASAWRSAHVSPPPAPLYARLHAMASVTGQSPEPPVRGPTGRPPACSSHRLWRHASAPRVRLVARGAEVKVCSTLLLARDAGFPFARAAARLRAANTASDAAIALPGRNAAGAAAERSFACTHILTR